MRECALLFPLQKRPPKKSSKKRAFLTHSHMPSLGKYLSISPGMAIDARLRVACRSTSSALDEISTFCFLLAYNTSP